MEVIIYNVPDMAIVSDTGEPEEVSTEHIFDTIFLIDPSVNKVMRNSVDDSYRVVCGSPEMVINALDGKMIGNNIIHLKLATEPDIDTRKPRNSVHRYYLGISFLIVCVSIIIFIQ